MWPSQRQGREGFLSVLFKMGPADWNTIRIFGLDIAEERVQVLILTLLGIIASDKTLVANIQMTRADRGRVMESSVSNFNAQNANDVAAKGRNRSKDDTSSQCEAPLSFCL